MTKKERVLEIFICAVCLCAVVFSLCAPRAAAEAAFSALSLCARRVVPGVFLFMAAAKVLAKCGAERVFSRVTFGAFEKLFGAGESGVAVIIMGLFSGYPAGAALAAEFIKNGSLSREEAERILPFATAASPAFLLGSVGAMAGDVRFGAVLFLAQAASAVLLLLLFRGKGKTCAKREAGKNTVRPLSVLTAALRESGAASLNICSFVTFFYVFSAMLFCVLPPALCEGFAAALIAGVLEISCGFARLALLPAGALRFFCGGLILGFAGFSVLLQSADALCTAGVSMKKYFLLKLLQAFACAAFAALFGAVYAERGKSAFLFFGSEHEKIAAIWEFFAFLLVFCAVLALTLLFLIKIFGFLKKIFKKLWKKNNL